MKSSHRSRRKVELTATLVVGMLVGVTCSDEIASVADAASELLASAVGYDNSASGLSAVDVQAALDEIEARVDGAEATTGAQGTTLSDQASALTTTQGELAGLTTSVATLSSDVEALKTTPTSAGATTLATISGLVADNVQQAIEAIVAAGAARQAQLDQVTTPKECPDGAEQVGGVCVEATARTATAWHFATGACTTDGYRLCRLEELSTACSKKGVFQTESEWTSTWIALDAVVTVDFGSDACLPLAGASAMNPNTTTSLPFRCCVDL